MRAARALATLDEVELGDHVCWRMDPSAAFPTDARAYVADGALYGDKLVFVAPSRGASGLTRPASGRLPPASVVLDLPDHADTESVLAAVRREARTAARQGFRSVRVLTERVPATAPGGAEELLAQELKLDEFASESGAIVVCAFRPSLWDAPELEWAACMHPHETGTRAPRPAFRMFSTGADRWSVDGVIDSECAAAFNAALRAAMRHTAEVRLQFATLGMIDAAGMQALVDAARHLPGRRIDVEGANETVRLCWELAGYADAGVPVVMAP
ncbi:MEDS domain-containing protein [Streptomyces sp. NPDC048551]|uniref:MEDS domain-containing protein n=1 Tax=Streptomyces sp. NPDC048551 TaxID=3155758 RepID=UPI0034435F89